MALSVVQNKNNIILTLIFKRVVITHNVYSRMQKQKSSIKTKSNNKLI